MSEWDEPRIDPDGEMHGFGVRWYARDGTPLTNMWEIDRLLRKYWRIPERQIETSVVLASSAWKS